MVISYIGLYKQWKIGMLIGVGYKNPTKNIKRLNVTRLIFEESFYLAETMRLNIFLILFAIFVSIHHFMCWNFNF